MCNYTCWNWMGRKLPTAFNSQQLLRWLRPKRYIFSIFLVNKKLKKICSNSQQEKWSVTIWHYSKRLPKSCRKYEILDTKKSSFVTSRIVLFGLFRKVQKSTKFAKSQKSQKSAKSAKSRKSTIFCCLKATIRDRSESLFGQQKSQNLDFSQKCRFLKFCVRTAKITISQNRKKVENFRIFRPAKKSKKCAVCRGDRWSQMAA